MKNYQTRIEEWMLECFGEKDSVSIYERNCRFLEEALELVQSKELTVEEAHRLVDYVFSRPKGEPYQEVGGVMVTLAGLCGASNLDMEAEGEREYERIKTPEMIAKIQKKHAAKPRNSPLPEHVDTK